MLKRTLAVVGAAALVGSCIYISTQVGLRSEGWHELVVELPRNPNDYATVGQTFSTPDGCKVLVTAVRREGGRHLIAARIQGTHRYALTLSPVGWEHSFAMDQGALEWTLQQACGLSPAPLGRACERQWHVLH
jgi:hypothetical protein